MSRTRNNLVVRRRSEIRIALYFTTLIDLGRWINNNMLSSAGRILMGVRVAGRRHIFSTFYNQPMSSLRDSMKVPNQLVRKY